MIHQKKKKEITKRQGSLKPGKAVAISAICPIIVYFIICRALVRDLECEFPCAVRMRRSS